MAVREQEELERIMRIGVEYADEKMHEADDVLDKWYYEGQRDAYQRILHIMTEPNIVSDRKTNATHSD